MKKYKSYGINPFKNMIGCFPVIIQIPILMGLYMSLKYPTSDGITKYPHFLWFNLTEPNLIMTIIAASMYFIQPLVNSIHYPKDQKKNILCNYGSFADIHYICFFNFRFSTWSILEYQCSILIVQMHLAHSYYGKQAKKKQPNLKIN